MLLLQSHYRGPVSVGQDNIDSSVKALARFDGVARRFGVLPSDVVADPLVLASFVTVMDDDLNTPSAMAIVFAAITQANAAADAGDSAHAHELVAAVYSIAEAVGLTFSVADEVPADALALASALDVARASKDFASADALRVELQGAGWTVETTKQGTTLRR